MSNKPKFKLSTYTIFLVYMGFLLSYFLYAGLTGTRMLGDDKEEFKADGVQHNRYNGSSRIYRSYHK